MHRIIFYTLGAVLALVPLCARAADSDYSGNAQVKTLLQTSVNAAGQTISYPQAAPAQISVLQITFPPGGETGWHKHSVPLIGYVTAGTLTIHFAGGERKVFHTGDAFAEAVGILHNGRNEGTVPVKLIVFIAGEKDVPYTVKVHADSNGNPTP